MQVELKTKQLEQYQNTGAELLQCQTALEKAKSELAAAELTLVKSQECAAEGHARMLAADQEHAAKQQKLEEEREALHELVDSGEAKYHALECELERAQGTLEGLRQQYERDQLWLTHDSCEQLHQEVQAAAALAFAAADGERLDTVDKVKQTAVNTLFQLKIKVGNSQVEEAVKSIGFTAGGWRMEQFVSWFRLRFVANTIA